MKRYTPFAVLILALLFWPDFTPSQTAQHGSFLSWTAPVVDATHGPAASYNIYRGTSSGNETTLVANVTTTSYVDPASGLTPGTTYFYVVKAVNSMAQEGASSLEASGLIPNVSGAPSALVDAVK